MTFFVACLFAAVIVGLGVIAVTALLAASRRAPLVPVDPSERDEYLDALRHPPQ